MQYQIIGQTVPAVECTLMRGESMFTQSGGMIWETEGISMKTNARGGIAKSLGRLLSGESIFMANYTAEQDNVRIAFGSTVPGSVIPVDVSTTPLIVQKGAFLCAEQSVQLDITLTKKLSAGFFGGEGFVLQKLSGTGMAFLEVDGDIVQYDLRAGDGLTVLRPGEVDNVVIAGMGGVLIGEILGKDPDLTYSFRRFILQPRNQIGKLRKALADLGIGIVREQIAEEGKFLCVILTAEPGAPCPSGPAYEDAPWLWDFPDSLIAEQDDLVRKYLKRESDKYKKIETQILEHSEDAARLEGIRQYLKRIRILIKEME